MTDSTADEDTESEPGTAAQQMNQQSLEDRVIPDISTIKKLGWFVVVYLGLLVALSTPLAFSFLNTDVGPTAAVGSFLPTIIVLAFVFETMDAAAGMGFGTILAPTLFAMGYDPLTVVPALLVSQMLAGLIAGIVHKEFDNADYSLSWPPNEDTKLVGLITGIGIIAIVVSVLLTYSVLAVPTGLIKTYVAILVVFMGVFGVGKQYLEPASEYQPKRMLGFAALAGFNKGLGAGGYGPVITLGEIYSGVYEKSAAAITTMTEGLVTMVGAATFFWLQMTGTQLDLMLLPSLVAGGLLAGVTSPYIVRVIPNRIFQYLIPSYAVLVGGAIIAKLYLL